MPRRNRPRPRGRRQSVAYAPPEIQPTPEQLARRLIARGLSDSSILGPARPSPHADADQLSTAVDSSRSDEEGDR